LPAGSRSTTLLHAQLPSSIHPLDPSGRIGKRCTTVDCPRTAHTSTVANLPFDKSESGWL
jgi:hypothetical protein